MIFAVLERRLIQLLIKWLQFFINIYIRKEEDKTMRRGVLSTLLSLRQAEQQHLAVN